MNDPVRRINRLQIKKLKEELKSYGDEVLPRVIAESINIVVKEAVIQQKKSIRSKFTLRNKYTENSVRYYKANPKKTISKMNAVTGSVSPYMDEQEFGGYRRPKKGRAVPVATLAARGGNANATVRKKFHAGTTSANMFIGVPRGQKKKRRPYGAYIRSPNNENLIMIRNISNSKIPIAETRWHQEAIETWATKEKLERAFIQLANEEIEKLAKA